MPWRELTHNVQAKIDYALGGTAVSAPVWSKFVRNVGISDVTDFFIMLTAIGGFVLICFRVVRQWRHRNRPPENR